VTQRVEIKQQTLIIMRYQWRQQKNHLWSQKTKSIGWSGRVINFCVDCSLKLQVNIWQCRDGQTRSWRATILQSSSQTLIKPTWRS